MSERPAPRKRRQSTFKLTAPVVPEHAIQATMTRMLTLEIAPPGKLSRQGVLWFSIDHANYAGEVPGIRVGRGIVAGIPDVFVFFRGLGHVIELKASGGQLTEPQKATLAAALLNGIKTAICETEDQVMDALDQWGIPRNRRLMFNAPRVSREPGS